MKIAFHGQRGSYAEAAAARMFADRDIATVPTATAAGVLEAVLTRQVQLGVLRYEMTEWDTSFEVLDLLRDKPLYINREVRFHERYNLAALPGVKRGDIRRVIAHPTLLHLCSQYLGRLRGIDVIARFDIAEALKRIEAGEAGVCGEFASSVYGLHVLDSGIENNELGVTRFVALGPELLSPPGEGVSTSLMFELSHEPGALMDALAAFRKFRINLNMVSARPNRPDRREYTVYVEFGGRSDDAENAAALKELAEHCRHLQVLGSYSIGESRDRAD